VSWSRVIISLVLGISSVVGADARSDYEMLFGEEAKKVQATADTKDDAALAAKVLTAAKLATDAPGSQVFFYQKAYELGIRDSGGRAAAIEALELLEKAVPRKSAQWRSKKLKLLEADYQQARGAARHTAAKAYLEMLLTAADGEAAAGKSKEAWDLYRKAYPIATYIRSPRTDEIAGRINRTSKQAATVEKRQAALETLVRKLAADPRDMETRTELILFCLVELDDSRKAASLLARGVDEKLRRRASLAAKKPEDVPEAACLELGHWYYESLFEKASILGRVALLKRAAGYYERYLALHGSQDVRRLNARLALEEINEKLAGLGQRGLAAAKAKGTVYVSGDDEYELRINGKVVLADNDPRRAKSAEVELKTGDVFAVRAADSKGGHHGFCLLFQGKEQGVEFSTDTSMWFSCKPADKRRWWQVTANRRFPAARQGTNTYIRRNVLSRALRPPSSTCMTIWAEGRECFLYHVVTANDIRRLRWVSEDATYTVSSTGTMWGKAIEPLDCLLTGKGQLHNRGQFAFQTKEEAKANIVITLKQTYVLRRILIENRRERFQDRAAGLTVWTATTSRRWRWIWAATAVQDRWMIELKSGVNARYVKIALPGTGTLHLAGVKIYADPG